MGSPPPSAWARGRGRKEPGAARRAQSTLTAREALESREGYTGSGIKGKAQRVRPFDSSRPAAAGAASTASGPQPLSTLPSPGGGAADASSSATPGAQAPPTPSSAGAAGESGRAAGESSSAAPGAQAPPTPSSAGAADASSSAAPGTQVQPTSVGGCSEAAALVDPASFGSWDAHNSTRDAAAPGDPDIQHEETVQQVFTWRVKQAINDQVQHFGHGSKTRRLEGELKATSPWF